MKPRKKLKMVNEYLKIEKFFKDFVKENCNDSYKVNLHNIDLSLYPVDFPKLGIVRVEPYERWYYTIINQEIINPRTFLEKHAEQIKKKLLEDYASVQAELDSQVKED
jgi:hypothetical protein